MPPVLATLLKSRRFWVAVAGVVIATGKQSFPAVFNHFTDEQIQAVIIALGSWIVGESLRSSNASEPKN